MPPIVDTKDKKMYITLTYGAVGLCEWGCE